MSELYANYCDLTSKLVEARTIAAQLNDSFLTHLIDMALQEADEQERGLGAQKTSKKTKSSATA
jgi:hypothetical protein